MKFVVIVQNDMVHKILEYTLSAVILFFFNFFFSCVIGGRNECLKCLDGKRAKGQKGRKLASFFTLGFLSRSPFSVPDSKLADLFKADVQSQISFCNIENRAEST